MRFALARSASFGVTASRLPAMSGRAAFLDSLAHEVSANAAPDPWASAARDDGAAQPPPQPQPQHNWALDVVDSGDTTNYVALARARSRAIASRVHDLHHVFTAYRQLLLDEAATQAAAGADAPTLGDDDDEAQLFSALAQSVMQMSEDVHHTGRGTGGARGRRRAKPLGTTEEARETEEQFDSLVDLLAKQATKLTDDLDAIVLLAQARIDRADADAQDLIGQMRDTARAELAALRTEAAHQVRMLLDLHAVRARHTKTLRRGFSGWRDKALHLTRRRQTLVRAAKRLTNLSAAHAWSEWVEYVHENRLEAAYALHATAVEAASTQLRLQQERTVEQSFWRAQAKSETRLLQASVSCWAAYAADCLSRSLAMRRVVQRLRSMHTAQAWEHWVLMVEHVKSERAQATQQAQLNEVGTLLNMQRESGVTQVLVRSLRGILAATFDAWLWHLQSQNRLELTRLRTVSRIGAIYQSRAWQQWVAVVEENRVALLCAEHDNVVAEGEALLRAQRELIVRQAKHRSSARQIAQKLTDSFSGWLEFVAKQRRQLNLLHRASARMRMGLCSAALDVWCTQVRIARKQRLTMQRVIHRIGAMCASRAWAQWLAAVEGAKAQRDQEGHHAAMDAMDAKLSQQRDSCVKQILLRRWKESRALHFGAWLGYLQLRKQTEQIMRKVVLRIRAMVVAAAFDAWTGIVDDGRHLELTRLRAISRIAGLYQERAWQQWIAVVDEARVGRERVEHATVVQSVGTAMMLQWEAYVRLSRARSCRRVLKSCFCEWAELMVSTAGLNCIRYRVVNRLRLFQLASVISAWHEFAAAKEWQQLKLLRALKRLSDVLLARSMQAWLCMVRDQRLAVEQEAHGAAVAAAQAAAHARREYVISQTMLRMGGRRHRILLHSSLHCWISWRDVVVARRVTTIRVVARAGAIYLRLAIRLWCLATEEGAKNRERLEYTAIIDDAEDILATQWETTLRHYLGRMDRLKRQRCLKLWVEWAIARAQRKNVMWRVCARLEAMHAAASFAAWQAHSSRSSRSKAVCDRAVRRLSYRQLGSAFGQWRCQVHAYKRVEKTLSRVERSTVAFALIAWRDIAKHLRSNRKMQSYRAAMESAENLCLAQFHRSIRLLTERCAERRVLRWLTATWTHWERYVELSLRQKMQAKAEFDLQEMQRQAEQLVELRVELAETHRQQAQLCHEAELSARREKAAAEAHFTVEQERSEQVQAVAVVRDEVLGLRRELSERDKDLAEASRRESTLAEHRELAERSRQEAERRAEIERSEFVEMHRQAQMESSVQAQSIEAAQTELNRLQEREMAEAAARQLAEREKAEAQRRASIERNENAEAKRQARTALDEISRLRKQQADELADQQRRTEAAVALERSEQVEAMESVQAEVSRMQDVFQAAGTPPASPRAPRQPGDVHDASSITEALRMTAETTQEELQRRADSVASLRAELAKAQEEARVRSEAEAEAQREAQAKAKAMIEQASDATSIQLAAKEIVARVESVAHGAPPAASAVAASAPQTGASRARRGSWLLVQSPGSSQSSPPPLPQQHHAPAMRLSPEAAAAAVAAPHQNGGLQIGFGHGMRTPPRLQQQPPPRAAVPNTVQRGAGSWRAYEKEAEELNAQAKVDARARLQAEKQAEAMAAKLAQMQAMLAAGDDSDHSSQGLD